jgi:hypothetical protein
MLDSSHRGPAYHAAALAITLVSLVAMTPTDARACGGTFCDARPTPTAPQPMPIPQTGENILFVVDDTHVEAHVQIQYSGDPEQFAWIVPVTAAPEISAGSQKLFENLLEATVPTFNVERISFDCGIGAAADASSASAGCGSASDEERNDPSPQVGDGGPQGNPDVIGRGVAGAFEYAVLEGGTVEGVTGWLDANGFAQDDEANEILAEYLAEDFLFVAFHLRPGAGLDALHPVVLRYEGDEPCVPIRLTRIAAEEDMGIRVFFLGDARAVPTNYRHVTLNPLQLDWENPGANYLDVVTMAVDEEGADGHAFVTEYAGTSIFVPQVGISDADWDPMAFVDLDATEARAELERQGLVSCDSLGCTSQHPLIGGLIEQFLADDSRWSGPDFAAELDARIVQPAHHALTLLERPYLTRLFTTISPHEMTEDPTFHVNAQLGDVSNAWDAKFSQPCSGRAAMVIDHDARAISYDDNAELPDFSHTSAAERIEEMPANGAPIVLVDHREAIDHALLDWNSDPSPDRSACRSTSASCGMAPLRTNGVLAIVLLGLGWSTRRRYHR